MSIATLIVTYNRKDDLAKCIDSVIKSSVKSDIIVVDNASTDGTDQMIESLYPGIKYIKLKENTGPAGGAETGQRYAHEKGYEFVWMLDDDVIVSMTALEELIRHYKIISNTFGKKIFLVSVAYGDLEFRKPLFNLLRYNTFTGLTIRINEHEYEREFFQCDICPMHGLFIPRAVFEESGFFDGSLFGWYDDTEFVLRAKKKGFQGFAVVSSKIFHPVGLRKRVKILGKNFTFVAGKPIRMYMGTRNNIIAQRKFLGWFNFYFIFFPCFFVRRLLSIILFYENKAEFTENFIKGIIQGLRIARRYK